MSDNRELIQKCQKKSRVAFDELYKKFSPFVYGICLRYCRNNDDAQDLLQECFMKIMDKIADFRFEGSFYAWLRQLTITTALNRIRLKKTYDDYDEDSDVIENEVDYDIVSEMSAKELLNFINALPDGYRTVFNLYVIEGYQHAEIAEMLGISESTSRSQLKKARECLKSLINKYCNNNE